MWLPRRRFLRLSAGAAAAWALPESVAAPRFVPATGPLRVHRDNPRYFADGSGRAIYLTGAHNWNNFKDLGPADPPPAFDYARYLDRLTAWNHNFMRMWTWELTKYAADGQMSHAVPFPWPRTGPGRALDGKPRFDLSRFDNDYFRRLRERVMAAAARGIYVSVMLFEGWALRFSPTPWLGHPFNVANNINGVDGDLDRDGRGVETHTLANRAVTARQEAYIRQTVDAVNDLDNVLYEIANESVPESTAWQYHLIRFVREYERSKPKQHPVGMTFQHKGGDNKVLFASPADWISPNSTSVDPYRDDPPAARGDKVILSDTDHLWGIGGDRAWVWKSFLRGLNPIYMDPLDRKRSHDGPRAAMGDTLRYARRVNLAAMTPQEALASSRYCLAEAAGAHATYLVWAPRGEPVRVDLSASPPSLRVEWLDVETSRSADGGNAEGGARRDFTPPFRGDAVLFLIARAER
jgi:hypothetical protein